MASVTEECSSLSSEIIVSSTPYKSSGGGGPATEKIKTSAQNNISIKEYSFKSTSWVELLNEEDTKEEDSCGHQEETREEGEISTSIEMNNSTNVKSILEDSNSCASYQQREFAIEILDASNEAKFDRLLKEDKIKSPFRRHPSNEGFDVEVKKAEIELLKKHDPSILDFKLAAGTEGARFNIPSNRFGGGQSLLGESEEACDGYQSSAKSKSPMKRKHTLESGETDQKKARFTKARTESSSSSENSRNTGTGGRRSPLEYETDPGVLDRRQKNIDYGKNTVGYDNYIQAIPRNERTKEHPRTPPKNLKYSRRAWDGLVKQWRKQLHAWDTDNNDGVEEQDDDDNENNDEEKCHY